MIGLTGVATAPANLAIQPSALAKEPYRVTVAVPELAKSGQCDVGRTGRVTFGSEPSPWPSCIETLSPGILVAGAAWVSAAMAAPR